MQKRLFSLLFLVYLVTACPPPLKSCGAACYKESEYCCPNGVLTQKQFCGNNGGGGNNNNNNNGGERNGKYGPIQMKKDAVGSDLTYTTASNVDDCQSKCFDNRQCTVFSFDTCGNGCWLKTGNPGTSSNDCRATGKITANRGGGGGNNGGGGGGATNKLGLAWGDWDNSDMGQLAGSGKRPTWFYTWSAWSIRQNTQGLEWVPMLHLPSQMNEWQQAKNTAGYYGKSPNFLFINEPDMNGVSPGQAVDIWRREFQPFKNQGKRLGGPSVASNDAGTNWMQQFMSQCSGCSIDFLPLHWYGARGDDFINYVTMMHNKFGKNIWVTEWGCATWGGGSCSDNDIRGLMSHTTAWMDQQPWIERYSWFAAMSTGSIPNDAALARNNALLGPGGKSRTFMGDQYIKGGH